MPNAKQRELFAPAVLWLDNVDFIVNGEKIGKYEVLFTSKNEEKINKKMHDK